MSVYAIRTLNIIILQLFSSVWPMYNDNLLDFINYEDTISLIGIYVLFNFYK